MATVKFKPKPGAEREIRYWSSTQQMLESVGLTVADAANSQLEYNGPSDKSPGFKVFSRRGRMKGPKGFGRWRVSVTATTPHAIRHNAIHNTLLRALGGGR